MVIHINPLGREYEEEEDDYEEADVKFAAIKVAFAVL